MRDERQSVFPFRIPNFSLRIRFNQFPSPRTGQSGLRTGPRPMMQPNRFFAFRSRTFCNVVTPPEAITGTGTAAARAASPSKIRTPEHAVPGDVGVHDRVQGPLGELPGPRPRRADASDVFSQPVSGHLPVPGVQPEDDAFWDTPGRMSRNPGPGPASARVPRTTRADRRPPASLRCPLPTGARRRPGTGRPRLARSAGSRPPFAGLPGLGPVEVYQSVGARAPSETHRRAIPTGSSPNTVSCA